MEIDRTLSKDCQDCENGVICLSPLKSRGLANSPISIIIDSFGNLSAKSQNLSKPITSWLKFQMSDHRIYIKIHNRKFIGFIKVGRKNLFYRKSTGQFLELCPLCVLDFYVHDDFQRSGFGKDLFEQMLRTENISVQKLAIDRPSHKFLSFLKKHYDLQNYLHQANNFVIFNNYFEIESTEKNKKFSKIGENMLKTNFKEKDSILSKNNHELCGRADSLVNNLLESNVEPNRRLVCQKSDKKRSVLTSNSIYGSFYTEGYSYNKSII